MTKMLSKKFVCLCALFTFGIALSVSSHALTDKQKKDVDARTKPVGSLCLEGDSTCGVAVAASNGKPKTGEEVYTGTCTMCHGAGVGGAPKFGDKAAWKDRIAESLPTLHDHAIAGIRAMPPKGTCAACSDDEVKAAVDYMVAHSK
ncbi:MAG: cytochrome c5 [Verrucomicrobiaceae bacterium]|nr:cytochrome c5 [Verrucomicrobiaceae bacterium]